MTALDDIREFAERTPCRNTDAHQQCTRQDRHRLLAAVEGVLGLHRPDADTGKCAECTPAKYSQMSVPWPCATVKAVQAALGGTA